MSFLRRISPAFTPPHLEGKSRVLILRERIVQSFLLVLAIGCLTAYLIFIPSYLVNQNYFNVLGFTILTIIISLLATIRKINYYFRASVVLVGVLGVAFVSFIQRGLPGDGRTFLVAFSTFGILLVGTRFGYVTLLINFASYAGMAYLFLERGFVPISQGAPNITDLSSWLTGGVFFGFINVVLVIVLGYLVQNLQKSISESETLANELGKERFTLQARVEQRTKDLQQRLIQIRVGSEISRAISSVLDPDLLFQTVVDLIHDRFDLYYSGLFIVDQYGYAVLRSGTGEAGRKMIAAGHRLAIGNTSMIGWCVANRQPRIALDVGDEAVRFNNPYLPETRSEIAVPIISRGEALGALSVQSIQPSAFGEADILILQGIADSLAVAMENARLFKQTQDNLEEIRNLNRGYLQQGWADLLDEYGELSCLVENPHPAASGKTNPMFFPITLRDQVLGTLTIETESTELTEEEKSFVEAITTQTALALENARLVDETQRRARQEETLNELTSDFSRSFSIEDLLHSALKGIGQLPSVSEVSVQLTDLNENQPVKVTPGGNGKEHK